MNEYGFLKLKTTDGQVVYVHTGTIIAVRNHSDGTSTIYTAVRDVLFTVRSQGFEVMQMMRPEVQGLQRAEGEK